MQTLHGRSPGLVHQTLTIWPVESFCTAPLKVIAYGTRVRMICTEYRVENAPDRNPGLTATYIADGPNIT